MTYQKLLKKTEICEHANYDKNGNILPNPGNFAVSISYSILEGGNVLKNNLIPDSLHLTGL